MALIKSNPNQKPVMDLNGPDGNAFALLGTAHKLARQLRMDNWPEIEAEMKSGNYRTLVKAFDKHFGSVVDLILPDNWSDYK